MNLSIPCLVSFAFGALVSACAIDPEPVDTSAAESAEACDVPDVQIVHAGGTPQTARIHKLNLGTYPEAVCNDGSRGYYLRRTGFGGGSKRWLIYLEGGGSCGSKATCNERWATKRGLMRTTPQADGDVAELDATGIKSPLEVENPYFFDANYVQLGYCSSDGWSGDNPATTVGGNEVTRFHFRGRAIALAVVQDLIATAQLGQADEVLLLGSSAGGLGTTLLADDLRALLPAGIRLLALSDAGFFIDFPTFGDDPDEPTDRFLELAQSARVWGGRGDKTCDDAAASEDDRVRCRSPEELLAGPHVTTRFFVRQSQKDRIQLKSFVPDGTPPSDELDEFIESFAAQIRTSLAATKPRVGVHSTYDGEHGVINETAWSDARFTVGGTTMIDAIGQWYEKPCTKTVKRIAAPPG
jgi:hypothetical protein